MVLNYIWIAFFLIAFITALLKLIFLGDMGTFTKIVDSTFSMSKTAFEISLGLTGVMAFWLGIMRIAEKGGAIHILAKLVNPFFQRIFPEIPKDHPAIGSILMNFSANMLGLDNAATPLGLKAMKEMQDLNPKKDTASNSQIMFLVLNTSAITIIPVSVMLYRAQLGAENPADVFIPILLATICSSLAGLLIVSIYQKINLFQPVVLLYLLSIIIFTVSIILVFSNLSQDMLKSASGLMGSFIILAVITFFIALAAKKKVNTYEAFVDGAKEGFQVAVQIIPFLVAMLVGIAVFRASGAMDYIIQGIQNSVEFLGINSDFTPALPTAFMKPLSGSGARALMIDTMTIHGVDSFAGRLSAIMQGSTETTFYILAVYFGSVRIKFTRYAVKCGLFADLVGIVAAILIAYLFFH